MMLSACVAILAVEVYRAADHIEVVASLMLVALLMTESAGTRKLTRCSSTAG